MSLKGSFNWLKQRLSRQPPPEQIMLSSEAHAKTKDDVFVAIPFTMDLKAAKPEKYRREMYETDKQVSARVDMAFRTAVADMTYAGLLKSPDHACNAALQSTKDQIRQIYGLTLESVTAEQVRGPAIPSDQVRALEEAAAAAREQAKNIVAAHTSAQELMKGLDTEIQVKKPLSLKKSGQQP